MEARLGGGERRALGPCEQIADRAAPRWFGIDTVGWAALFAAAAIVLFQVLVPPIVGLADNGDFQRIASPAGLFRTEKKEPASYFDYVPTEFRFDEPRVGATASPSSGRWIAQLAAFVDRAMTHDGSFDLRVLGAIHSVLLLLGLGLILSAARDLRSPSRWTLAGLLVLFFTDVGYVASLNSFYTQTASFLFLLLVAGFAAHVIRDRATHAWSLIGYVVAASLFVVSKPQETVTAPLFALVLVAATLRSPRPARRRLGALGAATLLAAAAWSYLATPEKGLKRTALYHTVFHEMLVDSPDPRGDLEALGVDGDLARYAGTTAYVPTSGLKQPGFDESFFDRVSHGEVVLFYLTHPARFWRLLEKSAMSAFTLLDDSLGTFEKAAGFPPRAQSTRFRIWSDSKRELFPGSPWTLLLLFGSGLGVTAWLWRRDEAAERRRLGLVAFAALNGLAATAFLVCTLGDSLYDLTRHLFAFHAAVDLILLIAVVASVEAIAGQRRPRVLQAPLGSRERSAIGSESGSRQWIP